MVNHSSVKLHFNQGHHSPGKGEAVVYLTTPLPFFGLFADSAFPLVRTMLKRGSLCSGCSFARRPRWSMHRSRFHKYCHISPPTHSNCAWTRSPPLLPPKGSQEEGAACREVQGCIHRTGKKSLRLWGGVCVWTMSVIYQLYSLQI